MATRLLYCHCAFAQAVPRPVKQDVLRALTDSGADFDAVADLCEMSARKDPALAAIPVVLCSGLDSLDAYASVLDCSGFMSKPLDPSKLKATVGKLAPLVH